MQAMQKELIDQTDIPAGLKLKLVGLMEEVAPLKRCRICLHYGHVASNCSFNAQMTSLTKDDPELATAWWMVKMQPQWDLEDERQQRKACELDKKQIEKRVREVKSKRQLKMLGKRAQSESSGLDALGIGDFSK